MRNLKSAFYEIARQHVEVMEVALERAPEGFWFWDIHDPDTVWTSLTFQRALGFSVQESDSLQRGWPDVMHPDDLQTIERKARGACGFEPFEMSVRYFHKSGAELECECSGFVVADAQTSTTHVFAGHRLKQEYDLADKASLHYENQLLNSDKIFRNASDLLCIAGFDGYLKVVNPAWENTLGWSRQELLSKPYIEFVHPEDIEATLAEEQTVSHGDGSVSFENRYRCKDGSFKWLSWRSFPYTKEKKIYAVVRDITLQKKAESEAARFKTISDRAIYGIAMSNLQGELMYINNYFAHIHGYQPEELLGKHFSIFHSESQMPDVREQSERIFTHGQIGPVEIWHTHRDGTEFPMLMSGVLIKDSKGQPEYVAVSAVDLAEFKRAQQKITALLGVEARQNESLKNFTHIVSHNLRIHAANMLGIMMMLKMEDPITYKNQYVQMLKESSEKLEETIGDLKTVLDIKLDKSQQWQHIDLYTAVDKSISDVQAAADSNSVEIVNEVPADTVVFLIPAYLDSILTNLILNAVQYCCAAEEGPFVRITAKKEASHTLLSVIDNGLGIDLARHKDKLFHMYKKFHDITDSKGQGLFFTKNQIEAMGGRIEVESEPEKGSTFNVYIPHADD